MQRTIGVLDVQVTERLKIKFLIVPSISQRVILGLDFWKSFKLAADIFDSAIVSISSISSAHTNFNRNLSDLSVSEGPSEVLSESLEKAGRSDEYKYPMTVSQTQQLNTIIDIFPNFAKDGLGRTTLITHEIDVGDAKPIKQRFYPVSPAVEKLMY